MRLILTVRFARGVMRITKVALIPKARLRTVCADCDCNGNFFDYRKEWKYAKNIPIT